MPALILCLFALLAGCSGVVGPSEETAPCLDGEATFPGPGPVIYAYEEVDGASRGCPIWYATNEEVRVLCDLIDGTVVISR